MDVMCLFMGVLQYTLALNQQRSAQNNSNTADDDITEQYMMSAFARVGGTLGPEFLSYLPRVMPLVLERARREDDWEALAVAIDDDGTPLTSRMQFHSRVNSVYALAFNEFE